MIKIENIEKTYDDGTVALTPINLEIKEGEVCCLLGPSGCGKSTLLRIIGGLIKPNAGKIYIDDSDVTPLLPEKRNLGFVFQNYALFPTMTVAENIVFGLKLRKKSEQYINEKLESLLKMMNIESLASKKPNKLSGGQQQRVALARALAIEPKILLLDEPLTALDAKLKDRLRIELAELLHSLNVTSIYVTHDQLEAMAIADNIVVMNKGFIEQIGTPKEIYNQPKTPFVAQFFGQTNKFIATVVEKSSRKYADLSFCELDLSSYTFEVGKKIEIYIRPEDIGIDGQKVNAKLHEIVFLGDKSRCIFETNGERIIADLPCSTILSRGEAVSVNINNDKIICMEVAS